MERKSCPNNTPRIPTFLPLCRSCRYAVVSFWGVQFQQQSVSHKTQRARNKWLKMVLAELGSKITAAISKMRQSAVIDEAVVDEMLKVRSSWARKAQCTLCSITMNCWLTQNFETLFKNLAFLFSSYVKLKEIGNALVAADVQLKLVIKLRTNIKKSINLEDAASGLNKRKLIQHAIFDELCKLLDANKDKLYQPKKGQPNVIMFVGLQGKSFEKPSKME